MNYLNRIFRIGLDFWPTEWCTNCHRQVHQDDRMYNHGVCPMCGHKGKRAGTIVDTYTRVFRFVPDDSLPLWKFWGPQGSIKELESNHD